MDFTLFKNQAISKYECIFEIKGQILNMNANTRVDIQLSYKDNKEALKLKIQPC